MSDKLIIESVENTPEQLKFMPLKGSIRLKLSDTISPELVKNYIKVYRISDVDGIRTYARSYSDSLREDLARFVDIEVSASGQVLIISPKDSFIDSSDYILYISKEIHSVKNTVTHSGASVDSVLISPPISNNIEIIPESELMTDTDGDEVFVATIKVDGKIYKREILVVLKDGIVVNNSLITIKDSSIINESSIVITADIGGILGSDYELRFSTGKAAELGDKVPDGTSKKVTTDDIMNFYNNPYAQLISDTKISGKSNTSIGTPTIAVGGTTTPISQTNSNGDPEKIIIEPRYPNKIFIRFEKEVDQSSINLDSIDIDIYEAFDNYNLANMGLFNSDDNYIVEFSLIRSNRVLQIELFKSQSNTGDKITKRWK